jgi:phage terminase large subunit-like protein
MDIMPTSVKLHGGTTIWPERMSEAWALGIKAETPDHVWETTWQGHPTNPKGEIYKREWFSHRFRMGEGKPIARWISGDTALSDSESSAESAFSVGELMPDYTLRLIHVWGDHVTFPNLVEATKSLIYKYNDKVFRGVIIEKKASGHSLLQVLKQLRLEVPILEYTPLESKIARWISSAVWCSNGMVQLPQPDDKIPWLFDFEQDLFNAPGVAFTDRLDSFSQLILFLSNLLSEGLKAKTKARSA